MSGRTNLLPWIPLISKLIWPLFIIVVFLIFHSQVGEVYSVLISGIKSGRSVEIGGFLKLGEAASNTQIGKMTPGNLPIKGIGGEEGVTRKGSESDLERLQEELRLNPSRKINTLLVTNNINYSIRLLKQYVSTLGLKYVVFLKNGRFDGWIPSGNFIAQLPPEQPTISYSALRRDIIGIQTRTVTPDKSAREVLSLMQEFHMDSVPVVNTAGQWSFFVSREEILAGLMSRILLATE